MRRVHALAQPEILLTGTGSDVVRPWPDQRPVLTLELDLTSSTERALVHLAGDLDMATAPTLLATLTDLAEQGCRSVDLQMRDVAFCDGSGLAVLLEGHRRMRQRDGRITLHDPCPSLLRILDICDLDLNLEPRPTPPAATAGATPGAGPARPRLRVLPPLPEDA